MADIGKTEVDAVVQERVSKFIQESLIEKSVVLPTVKSIAAMAGEDTIKVGRAGNFTVEAKVENTAVTPQVITYAADSILLDQHKVIQARLEDIAQVQATPDVVSDMLGRMSDQLALDIDAYLVTKLEATSAAAPDHRVAYANSGTDDTVGKSDILNAKYLLKTQNIPFEECTILVSAGSEVDLLAIDEFVHANIYGSTRPLQNGELGTLYGAKVVVSNQAAQLKTLVYHPTHCYFARQIAPRFERMRQTDYLADLFSLSNLYGATTMDSGIRGVMLGTAA